MDLSKLPRMSNTPPKPGRDEPTPASEAAANSLDYGQRGPANDALYIGAEIWLMTIMGVVLIVLGHSLVGYSIARLTHHHYATGVQWSSGDREGQDVDYPELMSGGVVGGQLYTDLAFVLLGVALIIDAIGRAGVSLRWRIGKPILAVGMIITVVMIMLNLYFAGVYLKNNSIPFVSLLAIALGGYLLLFQFAGLFASRSAPKLST